MQKDFASVSLINSIPVVLLVRKDFPANTLTEFIALAKKEPGKYTYAHPGVGTIHNMTMKLFTARSELEEEGIGRIRFFPDGSSTGGHIDLLRDEALWRIEVMWLTGDAKLREGADAP